MKSLNEEGFKRIEIILIFTKLEIKEILIKSNGSANYFILLLKND